MTKQQLKISEEFIDALGINIKVYKTINAEAKKTVLFLHGYKDAGKTFLPIIENLAQSINAVFFDLRGHGQSGRLENGASAHLLDHLKDLSFVAKHVGHIDLLVGHSMGANVALLFAAAYTDKIDKLMIIDALGPPSEGYENIALRLRSVLDAAHKENRPKIFATHSLCFAFLQERHQEQDPKIVEHFSSYLIQERADKSFSFSHDHRLSGPTPYRFSSKAWQYILRAISAKVMVVVPEFGIIAKYEQYAQRINDFKQCEVINLAGCGHHVHISASVELAHRITKFVDAQ